MLKLIGLAIVIIIILAGIDYIIESAGSHINIITITGKSVEGNTYFIDTVSLEKFITSKELYDEFKGGSTYKVKISNNEIIEIVNRIN